MIFQLHHLHLEKYFIKQQHGLNWWYLGYNFCVSTSYDIYTLGERNIEYSMLDNPEYNNISNDKYYHKNLHTIMLVFCVVITSFLTLLFLEVIANNEWYFLRSKTPF